MELFLSVADVSRLLNVTPQTVRLMVRQGRLAVDARTVSGIKLFTRAEVERLIAVRRASGRSPAYSNEQRVTHGEPT